jgi:hypothetical protein
MLRIALEGVTMRRCFGFARAPSHAGGTGSFRSRARGRASTFLLALCLGGALYTGGVRADTTMRCGNKLVATGDTLYDVRGRCGEPAFTTRRVEYRTVAGYAPGAGASRTLEVVIDEWTYDFGPRKFVQHLIFEQGYLVFVVAGRRGHKQSE